MCNIKWVIYLLSNCGDHKFSWSVHNKLNVCYTSISKSVELTTQKNHIGVSLKLEIAVSLYIGIPENMKEDEENKE